MTKMSRPWLASEAAYVRENCSTLSDIEMGEHLGRSPRAISRWRRAQGYVHDHTSRARLVIRRCWGSRSIEHIARAARVPIGTVFQIADEMGLDATGKPAKPAQPVVRRRLAGLSRESIEWAKQMGPGNPEAELILAMDANPDPAAGLVSWEAPY